MKTGLKIVVRALVSIIVAAILTAMPGGAGGQSAVSNVPSSPKTTGRLTPPPIPTRAVQVMSFKAETAGDVERVLENYQQAGVQVIILRVFHNKGDSYEPFIKKRIEEGVYFKTDEVPVVADLLGLVCDLAHKKGLRVVAWMTSRYADYGGIPPELSAMSWDFETQKPAPQKGMCPLIPETRERLAAIYEDLARYPIDGILIQDDLILRHTEGWNPKAVKLFEKKTGKKATPGNFFKNVRKTGPGSYAVGEYTNEYMEWRRWQNSELIATAEGIRASVHAVRPGIPVGMNMYYENITDRKNALIWFGQDMEATMASDLDFYALMLYHRQMEHELKMTRKSVTEMIVADLAELVGQVDHPARIWAKMQGLDWDTGARIPPAELAGLAARIRNVAPVSLVVVTDGHAIDSQALSEVFSEPGR